jgi:hypothetical protein
MKTFFGMVRKKTAKAAPWVLLAPFVFLLAPFSASGKTLEGVKSLWPDLLLCEQDRNALAYETHEKIKWEYKIDGPVLDVQPQPSGDWLVTGGKGKVFLLHPTLGKRPLVSSWDWSALATDPPVSAVAADWDLDGKPTLVLAADPVKSRIFLAEAKSDQPKIRWEFSLPLPPQSVRICPDSGNFLVTLRPSSGKAGPQDALVEEVYFQEDKVIWSLSPAEGLTDAWDAVRSPDSRTFVADGSGQIFCFDADKNKLWETALTPAGTNQWKNISVSLFENKREQILVLVSASGQTKSGRKSLIYVLNSQDGQILSESDSLGTNVLPALTRAVPQIQGMELIKK